MSASLVGSEMCIRDSPGGGAPPSRTPPRSASGAPVGPFRRQIRRLRGKPVSYTHLTLPTICSV
eukprot:12268919-Alexandrium_andersonii.AAC.1